MERLTRLTPAGYTLDAAQLCRGEDGAYAGPAAQRLALYENFYEAIHKEHQEIPGELERLRAAGREKSVRFRELMGRKLIINELIGLLNHHGL